MSISKPYNDLACGRLLVGDWLVILVAGLCVAYLFIALWQPGHANLVQIRQGDHIYATLSLNQTKTLQLHGPLGITTVVIENGKVRIQSSPCRNQYCVHQGWLQSTGQVAICLPNRISVELIGKQKSYDSLAY